MAGVEAGVRQIQREDYEKSNVIMFASRIFSVLEHGFRFVVSMARCQAGGSQVDGTVLEDLPTNLLR